MEQCGAGQLVEAGQTGQGKGPFEVWTTAHIVWWSWRRPQTSISGLAFDRELANHLGMDGYAPGPQGCPDTVHPVRQADAIVQVPTKHTPPSVGLPAKYWRAAIRVTLCV